MNRSRKAFAALAAAVLVVPAAAVTVLTGSASADADGKHRHDLDTYKREAWVELVAGAPETHTHLYCDDGDYVLDGMWKVDAHDGDDRTVFANATYADDAGEENEWHFRLVNNGPGRAQVKLFVTCLDNRTGEQDGHAPTLTFNYPVSVAEPVVAGLSSHTRTCSAGQIPVSPGFKFTNGAAGRVYRSYPAPGLDPIAWQWSFQVTSPGDVTTYLRCINRTTSSAAGHTHDVDADLQPLAPAASSVPVGEQNDFRIFARPHDEGNVGAFSIVDPTTVTYLGQDAQGQVRGFRFWNAGPAASNVELAVWGFDKRTKKNS